jgi:hypothetical protein
MNEQLQNYAREEIKKGLVLLPESWQHTFKRMYSFDNLTKNINDVVDDMPQDKLDWAMQQVKSSLRKQKDSEIK